MALPCTGRWLNPVSAKKRTILLSFFLFLLLVLLLVDVVALTFSSCYRRLFISSHKQLNKEINEKRDAVQQENL